MSDISEFFKYAKRNEPIKAHCLTLGLQNDSRKAWYQLAKDMQYEEKCVDSFVLAKIMILPGENLYATLERDEFGQESVVVTEKIFPVSRKNEDGWILCDPHKPTLVKNTFKAC